jgi:hypothetical protein
MQHAAANDGFTYDIEARYSLPLNTAAHSQRAAARWRFIRLLNHTKCIIPCVYGILVGIIKIFTCQDSADKVQVPALRFFSFLSLSLSFY